LAIQCQPDILLSYEVLAVGDAGFQAKRKEALVSFRQAGKSMLFVSHSPGSVREMCDRTLWIDHGSVMMDGRRRGGARSLRRARPDKSRALMAVTFL
jgi:ABC-type polysaccharide/polyol phosphate transport system ATPase subunit